MRRKCGRVRVDRCGKIWIEYGNQFRPFILPSVTIRLEPGHRRAFWSVWPRDWGCTGYSALGCAELVSSPPISFVYNAELIARNSQEHIHMLSIHSLHAHNNDCVKMHRIIRLQAFRSTCLGIHRLPPPRPAF